MQRLDGFSDAAWEVVQRKPTARILDCTAGNRHIWGKVKMRDDVIFTDKEPNLIIPADLLTTWKDLPNHFPQNYFHCAIIDPPFYFSNKCPYFQHPREKENHPRQGPFYGYPFSSRRAMLGAIYEAQSAISVVAPRLCFKWGEINISTDRILTLFDKWNVISISPYKAYKNFKNGRCAWVKLVRRTVDDKDGSG